MGANSSKSYNYVTASSSPARSQEKPELMGRRTAVRRMGGRWCLTVACPLDHLPHGEFWHCVSVPIGGGLAQWPGWIQKHDGWSFVWPMFASRGRGWRMQVWVNWRTIVSTRAVQDVLRCKTLREAFSSHDVTAARVRGGSTSRRTNPRHLWGVAGPMSWRLPLRPAIVASSTP